MHRRAIAVSLALVALVLTIGPRGGGVAAIELPSADLVASASAIAVPDAEADVENDAVHASGRAAGWVPPAPRQDLLRPGRVDGRVRPETWALPRQPLASAHTDRGPPVTLAPI